MEREEGYGLKSSTSITGKDHSLETGVTRFHNVYGPLGTYEGGKEERFVRLMSHRNGHGGSMKRASNGRRSFRNT